MIKDTVERNGAQAPVWAEPTPGAAGIRQANLISGYSSGMRDVMQGCLLSLDGLGHNLHLPVEQILAALP